MKRLINLHVSRDGTDIWRKYKEFRTSIPATSIPALTQRRKDLSHEGPGDISFIARETISYFVTSERSERGKKYDIVTRAIKLILPSLECDHLYLSH